LPLLPALGHEPEKENRITKGGGIRMLTQPQIIAISISTGLLATGAGFVWLYFKHRNTKPITKPNHPRLPAVNIPHPPIKPLSILLLLAFMGMTFDLSYGGNPFQIQSQNTPSWFINLTAAYPYPLQYNQTKQTNISINSSYPFNITFHYQLDHRDGDVLFLNISSPSLNCMDYTNGTHSNDTLLNWECNGTNIAAGYTTFQFFITDLYPGISSSSIITGTYQADVAQPGTSPLAYAPDNGFDMGENSSMYGSSYATKTSVYDTPATMILALQQLKQKQQNQTIKNMTITPQEVSTQKTSNTTPIAAPSIVVQPTHLTPDIPEQVAPPPVVPKPPAPEPLITPSEVIAATQADTGIPFGKWIGWGVLLAVGIVVYLLLFRKPSGPQSVQPDI
jgi:hypothetical protein